MRILIADDSPSMRQIVRRFVAKIELPGVTWEFAEAGDGEDAEAMVQEGHLDGQAIELMILDWMMPKVSGYELLQRLRTTEVFRQEPRILMLTAETYAEQVEACVKFGVTSYLTKPFTQDQLTDAILKCLRERGLGHAV